TSTSRVGPLMCASTVSASASSPGAYSITLVEYVNDWASPVPLMGKPAECRPFAAEAAMWGTPEPFWIWMRTSDAGSVVGVAMVVVVDVEVEVEVEVE